MGNIGTVDLTSQQIFNDGRLLPLLFLSAKGKDSFPLELTDIRAQFLYGPIETSEPGFTNDVMMRLVEETEALASQPDFTLSGDPKRSDGEPFRD